MTRHSPHVSAASHELEAAIEAEPNRAAAYSVYGDWLQERGDPRGALIALQIANKAEKAQSLLERNQAAFYGKMAGHLDLLKRFAGPAGAERFRRAHPRGAPTTWRWGFLETLWVSNKLVKGKAKLLDVEALDDLLGHPSTRFLRELAVGGTYTSDGGDESYLEIAAMIGRHAKPTLKKLVLGDWEYEDPRHWCGYFGDVTPMYKALRALESFTARMGVELGTVDLPNLKELDVELHTMKLQSVTSAAWPQVERVNIALYGDDVSVADLQPIFDGAVFPQVKHFGFRHVGDGASLDDAIAAALTKAKVAARLESLDLAKGNMTDAGAVALAHGDFPKLTTIATGYRVTRAGGVAALQKLVTPRRGRIISA